MDAKAVESTNKFSKVIRNHETSDKKGHRDQSSPLELTKSYENTFVKEEKGREIVTCEWCWHKMKRKLIMVSPP